MRREKKNCNVGNLSSFNPAETQRISSGTWGNSTSNNNGVCDCHFQLPTSELRRCGGRISSVIRRWVKSPSNRLTDWPAAGRLAGKLQCTSLCGAISKKEAEPSLGTSPLQGLGGWGGSGGGVGEAACPRWKVTCTVGACVLDGCSNVASSRRLQLTQFPHGQVTYAANPGT